jgi:hypothetical protein
MNLNELYDLYDKCERECLRIDETSDTNDE